MSTSVRAATENDFAQLLALVEVAIPETWGADVPVDREAIRRWLYASETQKHLYCIRVAEQDGSLVGFLFAGMVPLFWNPAYRIADEALVYVHPTARMTTTAQDLIWSFTEWAKDYPVRISPTGKADAAAPILLRMGFSRIGSLYMKSIPNGRRRSTPSSS